MLKHCEIAAAWTEQSHYPVALNVWRPKPAIPPPLLPQDGPRTLEEMRSIHKAAQARIAAAGAREKDRLLAIAEEARQLRKAAAEAARLLEEERSRAQVALALASLQLRARVEAITLNSMAIGPSVRRIVLAVAKSYGIDPLDLMSSRRTSNVVLPRQVVMYLAKTTTRGSMPEIGRRLGGKDHSTIVHGVRKIGALMAVDDAFRAKVEALRDSITEPWRGA